MRSLLGRVPGVVWICLLTGAIGLIYGDGYVGYDAYYSVGWGDDLAHGRSPDLERLLALAVTASFGALATWRAWPGGACSPPAARATAARRLPFTAREHTGMAGPPGDRGARPPPSSRALPVER